MMATNVAAQHKQRAYALIDSLGQDILVRQPPTRTTALNDMEKVLGTESTEFGYGDIVTVKAHVHQGRVPSSAAGLVSEAIIIGLVQKADIVLSIKLEDVLLDSNQLYGRTILDTARDVVVSGSIFEVSGTFRSGLAPLGPYILWVGLEIQGE